MTDLPTIKAIYTDGACSGNPGPGGWGTVIYFDNGTAHEVGGHASETTNNRMEMQAAIAALELLQQQHYKNSIELYTDSKYLIQGITQWLRGWKRKGWKTSAGKPVLNQDLWMTLDELTQTLSKQQVDIEWNYVKGHSGNVGNERCDEIAQAFSKKRSVRLKKSINDQTTTPNSAPTAKPSSATTPKEPTSKAPAKSTPATATSKDMSETRINRVSNTLKLLQAADELAQKGYLITTSELVVLTGISASEIARRGNEWTWRNWAISCVSSDSDQETFWQLERIGE